MHTSTGNPTVETRRSYDGLISTMEPTSRQHADTLIMISISLKKNNIPVRIFVQIKASQKEFIVAFI